MARLYLWVALSCLLAPATFLACLNAWALVSTGAPTPLLSPAGSGPRGATKWQVRLACLAAAVLAKAQHALLGKLRWALRSRSLGCGEPAVYPHRDPVLGLDTFLPSLAATRAGTFLELSAERFARLGRTYYALTLGRWSLMTDEPENVKAIMATSFGDWEIAGPRRESLLPMLGPRSVLSANGALWQHARTSIRPAFVRDQVADLRRFDAHVGNLLAALRARAGEAVELQALFAMMTMDSSSDFMLGRSTGLLVGAADAEARRFFEDFDYCTAEGAKRARLGMLMKWFGNARFEAGVANVRAYVRAYVAAAMAERDEKRANEKRERQEKGEDEDEEQGVAAAGRGEEKKSYVFLHELVDSGADEEEVLDQALSVILAGRDTTASALAAIFYHLARSPAVVKKLRREVVDMATPNPTWEELRGMKYLQNVIREVLRLYPPVGINSRDSARDTILPRGGGPDGKQPLAVPKGTTCRFYLYTMHRRKDIFGPDADEFRPERWESLRLGWEYTPFSGGPRICIGQQFALTQMSYVILRIMQNFESVEPADSGPLRINVGITMSMMDGCRVKMTPVRDAE